MNPLRRGRFFDSACGCAQNDSVKGAEKLKTIRIVFIVPRPSDVVRDPSTTPSALLGMTPGFTRCELIREYGFISIDTKDTRKTGLWVFVSFKNNYEL